MGLAKDWNDLTITEKELCLLMIDKVIDDRVTPIVASKDKIFTGKTLLDVRQLVKKIDAYIGSLRALELFFENAWGVSMNIVTKADEMLNARLDGMDIDPKMKQVIFDSFSKDAIVLAVTNDDEVGVYMACVKTIYSDYHKLNERKLMTKYGACNIKIKCLRIALTGICERGYRITAGDMICKTMDALVL